MSELKEVYAYQSDEIESLFGNANGNSYYLKSEVDSAIDELKREHHRERDEYIDWVNRLQKENAELKAMVTTDKSEADRYIKNLKRAIYIVKAERFQSGYFHFDLEKDFWADRGETDKENHYYEKREQCARLEKICRQRAKELK